MSITLLRTPLEICKAADRAYPHEVVDREYTPIARFVERADALAFIESVTRLQAHEEVLEALQECEAVLGQMLESPAHMAQAILAQGYAAAARESARLALRTRQACQSSDAGPLHPTPRG